MSSVRSHIRGAVAVATFFAVSACSDGPDGRLLAPIDPALASIGPRLVECPTIEARSVSGMLGPNGGSLRLDGHELRLPLLAVLTATRFRLTDPVSRYMVLELRGDEAGDFHFNKPATITIDYSRCTRSNIDKAPLTVWQIHPATHALLRPMGGEDDKVARTVTFRTDHLSTFSLAR